MSSLIYNESKVLLFTISAWKLWATLLGKTWTFAESQLLYGIAYTGDSVKESILEGNY